MLKSDVTFEGEEIIAARHSADALSYWAYESPQDVAARTERVHSEFSELTAAANAKRQVLEDDLAREIYAEDTRLLADRHAGKVRQLEKWSGKLSPASRRPCRCKKKKAGVPWHFVSCWALMD